MWFILRKRYLRHRERNPIRHALLILFFASLVCLTATAVLVSRVEKMSYGDSLWQVWQTITTVGYGDVPAKTSSGRLLTVLYGTLGIVILSQIFSLAVEQSQARREAIRGGSMKSPHEHGHLVIGFPGEHRALLLVEELRQLDHDMPICFVDAQLAELPVALREVPAIHFVKGPLTLVETYRRAGATEAASASIFPASHLDGDADAQTVVQVRILNQIAPQLRVVYLLVDVRNEGLFEGLNASRVHMDMLYQAVIQELTDPGVAEAIESMLSNVKGANPKTVSASELKGWTWGQLVAALHRRNEGVPSATIVPYALFRNGLADVAPDYGTPLLPTDQIILTSRTEIDWELVLPTLKK